MKRLTLCIGKSVFILVDSKVPWVAFEKKRELENEETAICFHARDASEAAEYQSSADHAVPSASLFRKMKHVLV